MIDTTEETSLKANGPIILPATPRLIIIWQLDGGYPVRDRRKKSWGVNVTFPGALGKLIKVAEAEIVGITGG